MPIGYTKEPPLKTFVVAKIKKSLTEKQLTLYKQKYHAYFYQHDYLKLIKPDKDKDYVLMLFSFPEDLEKMKEGFEVEEFMEIQLPGIAPIHREQKPIYDQYWNIVHPSYDYPHKQYKEIEKIMKSLIESKKTRNKCVLFDESQKILIEAEDECHINNIRHCVMVALAKLAEQQVEEKQFKEIQYYAKDLILAVYFEPCIMCAMALIHSRIKEVYYYQRRVVEGGLNEGLQINQMKQLNHKYLVFYQ